MTNADVTPEAHQAVVDTEHLRLLALAHYVVGGLGILFASLFIFHFVFLFVLAQDPQFFPPSKSGHGPPESMLRVMQAMVGTFILLGWSFGLLTIYAGRCIKRRSKHTLCLIVACLNLLFLPLGTLLGVSALMVLTRPSVKRAYVG